ncbi:MAG: glucose-6-phosphate isomerase [Blastomonas sp.]
MDDRLTEAWARIEGHQAARLVDLVADEARTAPLQRGFDLGGSEIYFDFAKTHLDAGLVAAFEALADAAGFEALKASLFAGDPVNNSEGRAAEHMAERGVGDPQSVEIAGLLQQRMAALVEAIDAGAMGDIAHVLHIGIGGSALGPRLAIDALARQAGRYDVAVVSNVDGAALEEAFARFDPARTLVAVASKTFTTTETLMNASSAIEWMRDNGVDDPYGRLVALTAAPDKAVEWGVDETRVLPFSETVGGRYSLWSSIGFPIMMAIGSEEFGAFLAGGAMMDRHFRDTEGARNIPLLAAFADIYYAQVRQCQTRAIFAYDERLRLLPDYLQQLEMESNGKCATRDGAALDRPSAPISWGGVGTDAQHAVFQLLHQGTHLVPLEFIASITPGDDLDPEHHQTLLANCFAQGAALMTGKASDDAARYYPGDRPSTTILLDNVDARTLGALIAFYEHRTFANAALLGINPFDQFGVELGKQIAKSMQGGDLSGFDAATLALIERAGL